jgi:hypothetical protein
VLRLPVHSLTHTVFLGDASHAYMLNTRGLLPGIRIPSYLEPQMEYNGIHTYSQKRFQAAVSPLPRCNGRATVQNGLSPSHSGESVRPHICGSAGPLAPPAWVPVSRHFSRPRGERAPHARAPPRLYPGSAAVTRRLRDVFRNTSLFGIRNTYLYHPCLEYVVFEFNM